MGYTKVDNIFIEKLIASFLTGLEFRVVLLMYRRTFGYQKQTAPLSSTYIARGIGVSRRSVLRVVKGLRKKNIIIKDLPKSWSTGIAHYELNKDLSTWLTKNAEQLFTGEPTSLEYAGSPEHYETLATHQILKKYKISRDQFDDIFTEFTEYVTAEGRKYTNYPAQLRRWIIKEAKENKFEVKFGYARQSN